jgi:hypothetical protein
LSSPYSVASCSMSPWRGCVPSAPSFGLLLTSRRRPLRIGHGSLMWLVLLQRRLGPSQWHRQPKLRVAMNRCTWPLIPSSLRAPLSVEASSAFAAACQHFPFKGHSGPLSAAVPLGNPSTRTWRFSSQKLLGCRVAFCPINLSGQALPSTQSSTLCSYGSRSALSSFWFSWLGGPVVVVHTVPTFAVVARRARSAGVQRAFSAAMRPRMAARGHAVPPNNPLEPTGHVGEVRRSRAALAAFGGGGPPGVAGSRFLCYPTTPGPAAQRGR